jgi:hypothetical protein
MWVQQGEASVFNDPTVRPNNHSLSVFKCCHCGCLIHTNSLRNHDYSICFNCEDGHGRGLRCNKPECRECSNFMKRIDEEEAKARRGY